VTGLELELEQLSLRMGRHESSGCGMSQQGIFFPTEMSDNSIPGFSLFLGVSKFPCENIKYFTMSIMS
jgi:hypothetical protein